MSRLIVKNLPKSVTKEQLKEHFSSKGQVTDVKLHFSKTGVFRRFGFIGYKTEEEAKGALEFFDKSYINTTKIIVDIAKDLGDDSVPRPWSKYSNKSSAYQRYSTAKEERINRIRELQNPHKESELVHKKSHTKAKSMEPSALNELHEAEKNPEFQEFLKIHQSKHVKETWINDVFNEPSELSPLKEQSKDSEEKSNKIRAADVNYHVPDEEKERDDLLESSNESIMSESGNSIKGDTSDLAWLQTKASKMYEEEQEGVNKQLQNKMSSSSESDNESDSAMDEESSNSDDEEKKDTLTLRLRGLPFKCSEEDIISFFSPLRINDIRIVMNDKGKPKGVAYVDFESPSDTVKGLGKNGSFIGKRYIEVMRANISSEEKNDGNDLKRWQWDQKTTLDEQEPISESGRLFVRNLSYTCTEEDIQSLFEKYGPLSEVHLPINKSTKATIGIGFVTFMMPEHAVNAYNALDGKIFQGRILHLLPANSKKDNVTDLKASSANSSYKLIKEKQLKATSSSSHNWNTLFLGANTVADIIADRLKTDKSKVLSSEAGDSIAVRVALGESQIVAETRDFLLSHGVKLDSFGQSNSKRSKTIIIVKNLPIKTKESDLHHVFSKYGEVRQIVIPPVGVTGLIEFTRPSEAKEAFQNLAYSKFKHVPLYLEWAPTEALSGEVASQTDNSETTDIQDSKAETEKTAGEGCVLFVKNLNFETTEEKLQQRLEEEGFKTHVTIARKKDPKKHEKLLSMGYGFVEFPTPADANNALIKVQQTKLEGHSLEFKRSNKQATGILVGRQTSVAKKQTGSKILVRNIPFEASKKEVKELFGTFGELKTVRLPSKVSGTGSHRGFGFIEFLTNQDAKRAFASLSQSTHLYGRRLVLEWAEQDETVDSVRKRTVLHYHADNKLKKKKREFLDDIEHAAVLDD